MMRWVVPVMASIRCSTRRATKMPPPRPSTMTTSSDHCAALATIAEQPPPFLEIAADQQTKTVGQFGDAHQRAMVGGVLLVEPAIRGLGPAGRSPSRPGDSDPTLPPNALPSGVVTR